MHSLQRKGTEPESTTTFPGRKESPPLDGNKTALLKGNFQHPPGVSSLQKGQATSGCLPTSSKIRGQHGGFWPPISSQLWENKNQVTDCSLRLITEGLKLKAVSYSSTVSPNPVGHSHHPLSINLKLITIKICFVKEFSLSYLICLHNIYLYAYLRPPYSISANLY